MEQVRTRRPHSREPLPIKDAPRQAAVAAGPAVRPGPDRRPVWGVVLLVLFACAAQANAARPADLAAIPSSERTRPPWSPSDVLLPNQDAGAGDGFQRAVPGGSENDGRWAELPAPPRWGDAAIVDAKRDRILLLGGFGWTRVDQLWQHALDPNSEWQPFTVGGDHPAPRESPTAIYDPKNDRALFFGGFDGQTYFDEVWELRLNGQPRWTLLSPSGQAPAGRFRHSAVFDSRLERMIVFGGENRQGSMNDAWALYLRGRLRWERLSPAGEAPAPRTGAVAVYDSSKSRMLLVGGDTEPILDRAQNAWELDLSSAPSWKRLAPGGFDPGPLDFGAGILDGESNRVLFYDAKGTSVLALSLGEPVSWTLLDPGSIGPRPRLFEMPVAVRVGRGMWIHGGAYGSLPRADTWTFALDGPPVWTRVPVEGEPENRTGHTAVFDSRRDRMILYGGWPSPNDVPYQGRSRHELWVQDFARGDMWTPLVSTGPAPPYRAFHTAIYDSLRDRMVIFGGYDGSNLRNDVWALNLGSDPQWEQLQAQGAAPSPRDAATAIYDPNADRMIVFGGGRVTSDTWALPLHGAPAWEEISPSGTLPPGRREQTAVYDPALRRMLVFGGNTAVQDYGDDVWSLSLDGAPSWQPIVVPGPHPRGRSSPVAVYDASSARMIIHGGYDGTNLIRDAWELSFAGGPQWRQLDPAGNPPVFWFDHSAVLEPSRQRMVIFGDFGSWSLDWSDTSPRQASQHPSVALNMAKRAALSIAVASSGPHPFSGAWELRVHLPDAVRALVEVRSVSGRLMLAREIGARAGGDTAFRIPESAAYPTGVYFLRLTQGTQMAVARIVHFQ